MKKRTVIKKNAGGSLASVEAARAKELQTLRRLRRQQSAIVEASRAVTRAVRRADVARIASARELCEGTEYGVYGNEAVAESQRVADVHQRTAQEYAKTILGLRRRLAAAGVADEPRATEAPESCELVGADA